MVNEYNTVKQIYLEVRGIIKYSTPREPDQLQKKMLLEKADIAESQLRSLGSSSTEIEIVG